MEDGAGSDREGAGDGSEGEVRPMVRWHGGKWVLAPWIISHFPPHQIYTEAFGGAASVLLKKPRCYAEIYNDLDGEIVNLFRVARERGKDLVALLEFDAETGEWQPRKVFFQS